MTIESQASHWSTFDRVIAIDQWDAVQKNPAVWLVEFESRNDQRTNEKSGICNLSYF